MAFYMVSPWCYCSKIFIKPIPCVTHVHATVQVKVTLSLPWSYSWNEAVRKFQFKRLHCTIYPWHCQNREVGPRPHLRIQEVLLDSWVLMDHKGKFLINKHDFDYLPFYLIILQKQGCIFYLFCLPILCSHSQKYFTPVQVSYLLTYRNTNYWRLPVMSNSQNHCKYLNQSVRQGEREKSFAFFPLQNWLENTYQRGKPDEWGCGMDSRQNISGISAHYHSGFFFSPITVRLPEYFLVSQLPLNAFFFVLFLSHLGDLKL